MTVHVDGVHVARVLLKSWPKYQGVLSYLHASGNQTGGMHASGSSQKSIRCYHVLYHVHVHEFVSDLKGIHHVGYFFGRLRPPDQLSIGPSMKFLTFNRWCLKESGWGPPASKTKLTSVQVGDINFIFSKSFWCTPRCKRQFSLNQIRVQNSWESSCALILISWVSYTNSTSINRHSTAL